MKRAPLRSPPAVKKQSVSYSVVEEDDDEEVAAAGAPSLYLPADATAGSNYGVEDDGSESGEGSENEGSASASESRSRSASENEGHDRAVRVVPGVAVARDWISEVEVDSSKLLSFGRSDKWTHLADVHGDFQDTARNVGRIIISEMHLPDECKTIKPTSLGGVAGGKKFIHSGILFKFAEDAKLGDGTYLYGGIAPDLSKANKACGHEIKSCNAFTLASMELGVSHLLRCPLMAKISYRGSVIVALSLLPISGGSLVLGSNNGKTCTRSDEEANSLTSQVCNFLGLQEHSVHGVEVPACGDLEVHRGSDGALYVLDFARLFPPEGPPATRKVGKEIFYALLRPEFVRAWAAKKNRLVSDVFSGWGRSDPSWREHNQNCVVASNSLREETVVLAARFVDSMCKDTYSWQVQSVLIPQLRSVISGTLQRRFGVNMRHLGLVRTACTNPDARMLLLTAMVARASKSHVNAKLRALAANLRLTFEAPFHSLIVESLNIVGGISEYSRNYWRQIVPALLEAKFGAVGFEATDLGSTSDFFRRVPVPLVQVLLGMALGCTWVNVGMHLESLFEGGNRDATLDTPVSCASLVALRDPPPPIQKTDLLASQPRVVTSGLADWFDARAKISEGTELLRKLHLKPALRVLQSARTVLLQRFGAAAEMLVDLAWTEYLIYIATHFQNDQVNYRPLMADAKSHVQAAEAMGCTSGRLRCVKILIALSGGILFGNTTSLFHEQTEWLPAAQLRHLVAKLSAAEFGLLTGEMTAFPLPLLKTRFALQLLRIVSSEVPNAEDGHELLFAWLHEPSVRDVETLIGRFKSEEALPVADGLLSPLEAYMANLLHKLLSEAFKNQDVKARLLEECQRCPTLVATHFLCLPLRQKYRFDEDTRELLVDGEAQAVTEADAVTEFVRPFCVKWDYSSDVGKSARHALAWLEICAGHATAICQIRCTHNSRLSNVLCSLSQKMPLLTTLNIQESSDLSAASLRVIVNAASESLCHVSLKSSNAMEASDVATPLCTLKKLKSLHLKGFDFSENNQSHLLEVLSKHSASLEEVSFDGYFGPFAVSGQQLPPFPELKKLCYATRDESLALLEELLAKGAVEALDINISARCAVPSTVKLSRLRVQSCSDIAPFLQSSLVKLTLMSACVIPAASPLLKQLRLPQQGADFSILARAPVLSRLRCGSDLPQEWKWSPLLTHIKLPNMRSPCAELSALPHLSVLVLQSSRLVSVNLNANLFTNLTVLNLERIAISADATATVRQLVLGNATLHTLVCVCIPGFSHDFIDDVEAREAFATRVQTVRIQSDDRDSFRSAPFVELLLSCKELRLKSLDVLDNSNFRPDLFLRVLVQRFPQLQIQRR